MSISKKIEVKEVTFSYEDSSIIENISLDIYPGELVGLLGHSGCGKTTLFNVIAGLNSPDKGSVLLDGKDITGKPGNISYMLQKDLLLPYLTIEDNVSLPLRVRGESKTKAREMVADKFKTFGLDGYEKKYPSQLSGGMRQRAALFRTYMFSQDVCLLDEPFSALDTLTKGDMLKWFLSVMNEIKLTTLLITHDIDEAIRLSDRIYILSDKPGRISAEIKIDEPKPRDDEFLLSEKFLSYKRRIIELL